MITIDKDRALDLLEQAVAERGADYIDTDAKGSCTYLHYDTNTPGCIVGTVFHAAGLPIERLEAMDKLGSLMCISPKMLKVSYDIDITEEAHALLRTAQSEQDSGTAWGLAVDRAIAARGGNDG